VPVPKVTSPPKKVQAAPHSGVAMAVIMTGMLMTAVDTTIVVLALPEIQRGLHVDLSAVVWVIISFLLVITVTTGLWVVVLASIINGIGASFFFPANSSAVMKAAPPESFGIASGMLRTFANIGMVFSFAVAILIASRSISRGLAFAIFVGSTSLHGAVAVAFTSGLHAAFYASMGFMALAAALSALRAGSYPETRV
jgi:MFS family permease